MRVLLTGANGFIGAHLTAALLAAGHQVVAAVRRPDDFARRFPAADAVAAYTAALSLLQPARAEER
ncbi:MAG TPA: NAD-dependent epimerase/dehydratase family protein [Kiloniellaceae bacterium]